MYIMTSDSRFPAPGWGWRSKSRAPLKGMTKFWLYTTQSLIGITFLMQHKILTNDLIESKIET